jgi:hypothetical protein
MSRVYFNGVSQVSFNGHLLSFALDDVFQRPNSANEKAIVIELISELETAEGVCRYILAEIEKIKQLSQTSERNNEAGEKAPSDDIEQNLKLGPRLTTLRDEHGSG